VKWEWQRSGIVQNHHYNANISETTGLIRPAVNIGSVFSSTRSPNSLAAIKTPLTQEQQKISNTLIGRRLIRCLIVKTSASCLAQVVPCPAEAFCFIYPSNTMAHVGGAKTFNSNTSLQKRFEKSTYITVCNLLLFTSYKDLIRACRVGPTENLWWQSTCATANLIEEKHVILHSSSHPLWCLRYSYCNIFGQRLHTYSVDLYIFQTDMCNSYSAV